ncbi:hypothetical protein KKA13_00605, partial [Patescibacteria group bacterium]|nr:hypothetical protein [Patescibacteria group bacterium]
FVRVRAHSQIITTKKFAMQYGDLRMTAPGEYAVDLYVSGDNIRLDENTTSQAESSVFTLKADESGANAIISIVTAVQGTVADDEYEVDFLHHIFDKTEAFAVPASLEILSGATMFALNANSVPGVASVNVISDITSFRPLVMSLSEAKATAPGQYTAELHVKSRAGSPSFQNSMSTYRSYRDYILKPETGGTKIQLKVVAVADGSLAGNQELLKLLQSALNNSGTFEIKPVQKIPASVAIPTQTSPAPSQDASDAQVILEESDENNSTGYIEEDIEEDSEMLPDLSLEVQKIRYVRFSWSWWSWFKKKYIVYLTVKNNGNAFAYGPIEYQYKNNENDTWIRKNLRAGINAGKSEMIKIELDPSEMNKNYSFQVDPENKIRESNEKNNGTQTEVRKK